MPIRIDLNPKVEVQTSIGPVFIYETATNVINKYGRQPDSGPLSKVRQFLEQIATTRTRERSSEHIPLSKAEAKSLTDDDIELMANGYLKLPNSLYYIAEGRNANPPMAQGKEESAVAFLDRLLLFRVKHDHDSFRRLADLANPTRALIEQTFGKSAAALRELDESASGLSALAAEARRQQSAFDESRKTAAVSQFGPDPAIKAMLRDNTQRRQERKEELDLARSMREMAVQSVDLLAKLSHTTTTVLKQFGDFLGLFSEANRQTSRVTRLALWIAACSLFMTAVLGLLSYWQDVVNNRSTDRWQAEVSRALKKQTDLADQSLRMLSEENAKLRERVEALETSATRSRDVRPPRKP